VEKIDLAVGLIREQINDINQRLPALLAECNLTPKEEADVRSMEVRG
jgi:hypothetical protein